MGKGKLICGACKWPTTAKRVHHVCGRNQSTPAERDRRPRYEHVTWLADRAPHQTFSFQQVFAAWLATQ